MKNKARWFRYALLGVLFGCILNIVSSNAVFADGDCAILNCSGDLTEIFGDSVDTLEQVAYLAAGISIVYAGILWSLAFDNEGKVATAKKRITEVCIGISVLGLKKVIDGLLFNGVLFGGDSGGGIDYGTINRSRDIGAVIGSVAQGLMDLSLQLVGVVQFVGLVGIVYGGWLYASSAGNSGNAARGKKAITNAIIGTIICAGYKFVGGLLYSTFYVTDSLESVATKAATELTWWVGSFSVAMIIYGAILIAASAGDSGKVSKGKTAIIYAVIGLAISIAANAILNYVAGAFGVNAGA